MRVRGDHVHGGGVDHLDHQNGRSEIQLEVVELVSYSSTFSPPVKHKKLHLVVAIFIRLKDRAVQAVDLDFVIFGPGKAIAVSRRQRDGLSIAVGKAQLKLGSLIAPDAGGIVAADVGSRKRPEICRVGDHG